MRLNVSLLELQELVRCTLHKAEQCDMSFEPYNAYTKGVALLAYEITTRHTRNCMRQKNNKKDYDHE